MQDKEKLREVKTRSCEETFIEGHHECEICYEGEADLHKHCVGCNKNPGHINFTPVNDFNLDHLPFLYRDDNVFEVIKALSALTVMIKVNYTSLERSESSQYPFYNIRGSDVLRTGTGSLYRVYRRTESEGWRICSCGKCKNSDTPSKIWWVVTVMTASHVVFDQSEAEKTKCTLDIDDSKSSGVSLEGWDMWCNGEFYDRCELAYETCDEALADQLDKKCQKFNDLCKILKEKYPDDSLLIIVSHPHGCPEMVSIGQLINEYNEHGWYQRTYTTSTCPGSSGAYVYRLGTYMWSLPHSGTKCGLNYSGKALHNSYKNLMH
ncbi:uncharacterized protein LOC131945834 [Physella acuta]|uniref:uncharacterized protein LOC131945834 n=1 Tax=Physella acuta TaxID=109671 RepID=UPI0027DDE3EF|nr:uncharacterized protein LOC131945834 [Physella acuta]